MPDGIFTKQDTVETEPHQTTLPISQLDQATLADKNLNPKSSRLYSPAIARFTTMVLLRRSANSPDTHRVLQAVSEAYDGDVQMIDSSSIRVHQHGANGKKNKPYPVAWAVRAVA